MKNLFSKITNSVIKTGNIAVIIYSLFFLFVTSSSFAQSNYICSTTSQWNNFKKYSFMIDKHSCYVVEPKVAASGKPWIWRTSFPDYHPEVDLQLLNSGYHVGYIDCLDMLGSDSAVAIMDKFYEKVLGKWALAKKPAIEAVSRGGLHAYRYAAEYPQKIACIYADTPVMDLKSWPLKWPDAKQQVQDALKYYNFKNVQELIDFKSNPVDLLEPIFKAGIPVRHVVCLNDTVVPPENNTFEAQRRFKQLGYDMDIVVVKESSIANGHHFSLPQVFETTRFIMKNTTSLPKGKEYFELRNGLANCKTQFEQKKFGRVVFLGGSITFNPGWRDKMMEYLKQQFPKTEFDFIAAGIPSVGSNGHAFRLEQDVLTHGQIDLIFIEAAVNDGTNIPDRPDIMLKSMEGLVRQIWNKNPMTDIIQMHFVSPEVIAQYNAAKEPEAVAQHERVAEYYGCTSLNLALEVTDRINAGEFTWITSFNNVHPPLFGQQVYSNSMMRMLDAAFAQQSIAKPHLFPESMIDEKSYVSGRYGKLENAKLIQGFSLDNEWNPKDHKAYRDGFYRVPAITTTMSESEFEYDFEGTAFGLFLAAGPDSAVIEFSIDGSAFKKIDTFNQWSSGLYLPWPLVLDDQLLAGKHKVVVRTTNIEKSRTGLHIIHILLN